jgi:3D (Asp-Asp-Asp) domain-containing protein
VRSRSGIRPARLAVVVAGVVAAATLPAGGGADPNSTPLDRAGDLRAENAALAQRSSAAQLELYALDSKLVAARAELARLRARAAELRRQRADVRLRIHLARRAFDVSQRQLAQRLHVLYVQGQTDPMAVLLGAESLDDAVDGLEELNRTASLNESVITQALAAQKALRALSRSLAKQTVRVEGLERAAAASTEALDRAVTERRGYIASLRSRQQMNARTIDSIEAAAAAARTRTAALTAATSSAGAAVVAPEPADPLRPGQTLTVAATAYAMSGSTATGLRAGWGVVAVDPGLIPLGTRMTIPGYGEGVAADIGHAVRGAAIDLWFPTRAQALAWGRRVVTITLH